MLSLFIFLVQLAFHTYDQAKKTVNNSHFETLHVINSTLTKLHSHLKDTMKHYNKSKTNLNGGNQLHQALEHTKYHSYQSTKQPLSEHTTHNPNNGVTVNKENNKKRAVLFTMDSISSYEANSRIGGAAGPLINIANTHDVCLEFLTFRRNKNKKMLGKSFSIFGNFSSHCTIRYRVQFY
jgi:hypothetical protein